MLLLQLSLLFLAVAQGQQESGGLRFRDVPSLPVQPVAVNDAGEMVGNDAALGAVRILPDGTVTPLGTPADLTAVAMNNRGQVLLNRATGAAATFLWQPDGTIEERTLAGAVAVIGRGLNDNGEVAGSADRDAVIWDAEGNARLVPVPMCGVPGGSGCRYSAADLDEQGNIIGWFPLVGPWGLFRLTPDGFYREIGRTYRSIAPSGIGRNGLVFYTYFNLMAPMTSIVLADRGDTEYWTSHSARRTPDKRVPLFSGISPGGNRLTGYYDTPRQEPFVAETCETTVTPREFDLPLEGGSIRVSVTAADDCEWTTPNGRLSGSAEVEIPIPPAGTGGVPIVRSFGVAGKPVRVRMGDVGCEYSLPGDALLVGSEGGQVVVPLQTAEGCPWTVTSTSPGVAFDQMSGTGPAELHVTVGPNFSGDRTWRDVTIAGQRFIVYQDAGSCDYPIDPLPVLGAGSGTFAIVNHAPSGCLFTVETNESWQQVSGAMVTYRANTGRSARTGVLRIGNRTLTVVQSAAAAGEAVAVEPASSVGLRQRFRFTLVEPVASAEFRVGSECTVRFRLGLRPFTTTGTCKLLDASATVAGTFRTVLLDLEIAERGSVAVSATGRHLGVFFATVFTPPAPGITVPVPVGEGAVPGRVLIDSNQGIGGVFRFVGDGDAPVLVTWDSGFSSGQPRVDSCAVEVNPVTRRIALYADDAMEFSGVGTAGAVGLLENSQCVVDLAKSSIRPSLWDLAVYFRSTWTGGRVISTGRLGVTTSYLVMPAVSAPSLAVANGAVRVGFSAHASARSARVRIGDCTIAWDVERGLSASASCALDLARSAVEARGNDLALVLALNPGSGEHRVYAEMTPTGGIASGWFDLGPVVF